MTDKVIVARSGNFLIYRFKEDGTDFVGVKGVGGEWELRYRVDSLYYVLLTNKELLEESPKFLEILLPYLYVASTVMPDVQFIDGFMRIYTEFLERQDQAVSPEVRSTLRRLRLAKPDSEDLADMKAIAEMESEHAKTPVSERELHKKTGGKVIK